VHLLLNAVAAGRPALSIDLLPAQRSAANPPLLLLNDGRDGWMADHLLDPAPHADSVNKAMVHCRLRPRHDALHDGLVWCWRLLRHDATDTTQQGRIVLTCLLTAQYVQIRCPS